jgi:hypothetical protein
VIRCGYDALVSASSLKPHPRNPNKHPEEQLLLYAKLIRKHGWRAAVRVSKRSGYITAGHGAVLTALREQWKVPVVYQPYASEKDEVRDLVADNAMSEHGRFDFVNAGAILRELKGSGMQEFTGFADFEITPLTQARPAPKMGKRAQANKVKVDQQVLALVRKVAKKLFGDEKRARWTEAMVRACEAYHG